MLTHLFEYLQCMELKCFAQSYGLIYIPLLPSTVPDKLLMNRSIAGDSYKIKPLGLVD